MNHCINDLIQIFDQSFFESENTRLIKGEGEPIYLPAHGDTRYHRIEFAHGFYASAMHEIAHWCLAGKVRRQLPDYGYWYIGDGRDAKQQSEFEKVEIKPQAIEWGLCLAAGFTFNVSSDNLDGVTPDRLSFQHKVYDQLCQYFAKGFPKRAQQLMDALQDFYGTQTPQLSSVHYQGMYLRDAAS
ncbi:elongation factor P hydroxylase [Paraferrimonas sp. SM1919]|uniref:elongation factor P hydroxylase n=1 Tax=Paraferrimonas sp. SM1919 TaxID=2662263 RepID=UPI0013D5C779|nr:elongation factor P hydroxylase [Paraferrimonas sp. SM1919]